MKMKYLVTTKKPEENKLIVGSLGKDEIVIKNREFGEYSFSFKNNGEVIVKNGSNGDVIKTEEQFYLNTAGFEYSRSILESELYKKMSELFTEEWRNNEIGGRHYYRDYYHQILDDREESRIGLFKILSKEKKQGMCR